MCACCLCIQWVPEITHHCPKTPFLLVGTQIDLRDDPSTIEKLAKNKQKPITPETAEKLARDLKAVKYVECSALTQVIQSNYVHIHNSQSLIHSIHTEKESGGKRNLSTSPPGLCTLWLVYFACWFGFSDCSIL